MNQLQLNNTGGFPFDTDTLEFMQSSYSLFNVLGELAGNLAIIKGCTATGTSVSDGAVFINGELLSFKGGTASANVIIKEERKSLPFEDGQNKEVEIVRYATFGVGTESYAWADFKHPNPLLTLTSKLAKLEERLNKTIPIGIVAIWDRPAQEIPEGWVEHIDLKGRVPAGQDTSDNDFRIVGANIGEKKHTLTISEMPAHNHRYGDIYYSEANGTVTVPNNFGTNGKSDNDNRGYELKRDSENTGSGQGHNNVQPTRIVKFIRFVGFN